MMMAEKSKVQKPKVIYLKSQNNMPEVVVVVEVMVDVVVVDVVVVVELAVVVSS